MLPKLYFGPMSKASIEAVYKYSHNNLVPLGLIASLNQVNWQTGYTGLTTESFVNLCHLNAKQYEQSRVLICRDHCGPGFKSDWNYGDLEHEFFEDCRLGFDIIHVDLSKSGYSPDKILTKTAKYIRKCREWNPRVRFEVGTDKNIGFAESDLAKVEKELAVLTEVVTPEYYVVNTGSLVQNNAQVGEYDCRQVEKLSELLNAYACKLKEHNADFLSAHEISYRNRYVAALNIAPQLGYTETRTILHFAAVHGINTKDYVTLCFEDREKIKTWFRPGFSSLQQILFGVGHYYYQSPEFRKIYDELNKKMDIYGETLCSLMSVIDSYAKNFKGLEN